eukprot:gene16874-22362_t
MQERYVKVQDQLIVKDLN